MPVSLMSAPIDLFLFDLAGTTVVDDRRVQQAFERTAAAFDLPVDPVKLQTYMGWHKERVFSTLLTEARQPTAAAAQMAQRFEQEFAASVAKRPLLPTKGAVESIHKLAENGIQVGFVTGFSRSTMDLVLRALDWQELTSVASDEVEHGRPAPDLILAAMAKVGVTDPRLVGVAGDTPSDLEAGTAAGCRFVVGVGHGTHTIEQLAKAPHTHLMHTLEGLVPTLLSYARRP